MQESGLTDIIPVICNQPSEISILCYILSFLRAHHRVWLQSDGYYVAGILSFLSSLKAHQLTIHGGCNHWWLWHPLFTDMARNIPFLTCMHSLQGQPWSLVVLYSETVIPFSLLLDILPHSLQLRGAHFPILTARKMEFSQNFSFSCGCEGPSHLGCT